jgi:hypothetical protein
VVLGRATEDGVIVGSDSSGSRMYNAEKSRIESKLVLGWKKYEQDKNARKKVTRLEQHIAYKRSFNGQIQNNTSLPGYTETPPSYA